MPISAIKIDKQLQVHVVTIARTPVIRIPVDMSLARLHVEPRPQKIPRAGFTSFSSLVREQGYTVIMTVREVVDLATPC